jgi:hypothetical protein
MRDRNYCIQDVMRTLLFHTIISFNFLFVFSNQIYGQEPNDTTTIKIKKSIMWVEHTQSTKYFFTPNGYGLKKGEGYYQNSWVLTNQAAVGITNHFSLGCGLIPLFLFNGASTPVWISPKFSIPIVKDRLNMGVGALIGSVVGGDSESEAERLFGMTLGTFTYGSKDRNVSLGIGYVFTGNGWESTPTIHFGGMFRIGRKGYIMLEGFSFTGEETFPLVALGGRTVWSKLSLDYGLMAPVYVGTDIFIAIPWLGVAIPFGRKRNDDIEK